MMWSVFSEENQGVNTRRRMMGIGYTCELQKVCLKVRTGLSLGHMGPLTNASGSPAYLNNLTINIKFLGPHDI